MSRRSRGLALALACWPSRWCSRGRHRGCMALAYWARFARDGFAWWCARRVPRDPVRRPSGVLLLAPGARRCGGRVGFWSATRMDKLRHSPGIVVTGIASSLELVERARYAIALESARSPRCSRPDRHPGRRRQLRCPDTPASSSRRRDSRCRRARSCRSMAAWWPVKPRSFRGSGRPNPFGVARATRVLAGRSSSSRASCRSARPTPASIARGRASRSTRDAEPTYTRASLASRAALADRGGLLGLSSRVGGGVERRVVGPRGAVCHRGVAAIGTATVGSMAGRPRRRAASSKGSAAGIAYRAPLDWDRAGEVSIVAFCARGTLLLGEPELGRPRGGREGERRAGARARSGGREREHPPGGDGHSTCRDRPADPRRTRCAAPASTRGLGVLAVASTGEQLCVGSRALMLKEKISVAIAEQKVAEIEAHGREVLLVALAASWSGPSGYKTGCARVPGRRAAPARRAGRTGVDLR